MSGFVIDGKESLSREDIVELIRNTDINLLRDALYLEHTLLPMVGFHRHPVDHYPERLQPYCGTGIESMQLPNQFSKYLAYLATKKIDSYLEIGVSWGGTFILTLEYLRRFNGHIPAMAIDMINPEPNVEWYASITDNVSYLVASTTDPRVRNALLGRMWGLALVDADHSEEGCWRDYMLVRDHTKLAAFHDVGSDITPGVRAVWRRLRETFPSYRCKEFLDQYSDVRISSGYSYMGLGVVELL